MTAPLRYRSADDKTFLRAREQEAQDVDLEAERVSTLLQETSTSKIHPERSLVLGSICTGGLIAVWIGGAKAHAYYPSLLPDGGITQDLFLLIRYTNMSACAVLLPVSRYLQARAVMEVAQRDVADDVAEKRFTFSTQFGDPAALETFKRAALFCWIYYLMGYTYMASLQYNTIGVNTSLYNIYVVFVLVLSKLVLKEEVTPSKVAGVSLIVIGCTALGFDSSAGDMGASVFGVFLIMLSAFLYSVYQVAYAKWIQNAVVRPDQTLGWIGMMGLSLILSSPLALAAGLASGAINTGSADVFMGSSSDIMLQYLLVTSGTTVAYMLFLLAALRFSDPLFVSTGCVLVIPCSYLLDFVTGVEVSKMSAISGAIIMGGFVIYALGDAHKAKKATAERERISLDKSDK